MEEREDWTLAGALLSRGPGYGIQRRKTIVRGLITKRWHWGMKQKEALSFYLFIAPWMLGFVIFVAGPILASLGLSFAQYDIILPPKFRGLDNYRELFQDPLFYTSLWNTLYFVFFAIPLGIVVAFGLALLLNQKVRGMAVYRTAYYMPSIVPVVASAVLWLWLLQPQWGLVNGALRFLGIEGPTWLASPTWSKPSIILMMLWGSGGSMIIYLAGLQGIPQVLYEAAEIDGANWWARFRHMTIPMMTPTLFFTLVMSIISVFQTFSIVFIMTGGTGAPVNTTLVYLLYLYRNAFNFLRMGYASAMAWILFVIILALTLLQFRSASFWVYYEVEGGR